MNYYVISDTHLGHDMLWKRGHRSIFFEAKIMKNLSIIKEDDVLIHLGDFAFYDVDMWAQMFVEKVKGKKWLIKGNHDRKSNSWYLSHGWDFVADKVTLKMFGADILLSHIPQPDNGTFDFNVHGHLHDNNHRHEDADSILTEKHKLVFIEHHYAPQNLRKIIGR